MSRNEDESRPVGVLLLRVFFGAIALVMVPPFIVLAMAPMLLVLAPVALVAIPFMISAFASGAREVQPLMLPRRVRALRHAHL